MNTTPPLLESTRLDELRFSQSGVSLNLQGQSIWIKKESDQASTHALQTLFEIALKHSLKQTKERHHSAWYKKIGIWISNLFGKSVDQEPSITVEQSVDSEIKPHPSVAGKKIKASHPVLDSEPSDIQMKAIYADKGGIHVIWTKTEPGKRPYIESTTHALDSEVANTLTNCYQHLSRLGYTVVGIDMKPIVNDKKPSEMKVDLKQTLPSEDLDKKPKISPVIPDHAPPKTIVVRPLPIRTDDPSRLYISPVDNEENTQSIPIPERLLNSIRLNTDPALSPDKRVSFLRCAPYKGSYKIIAVGEGITEKQNAVKWTELSRWTEAQLNADKKKQAPKIEPSREQSETTLL